MTEPAHDTAAEARKERRDDLGEQAELVRADVDALEAQAVLDRELIEHLQADGVIDSEKIANLEHALVSARRIGEALGILTIRMSITSEQAFQMIKLKSQNTHTKLREVADEVIRTGTLRA